MVRRLLHAQAADPLPTAAAALVTLDLASPWLLGFSASHAAVAGHIAFAMAFVPLALLITVLRPAAVSCVAGGVWLAASPWSLGYASAGVGAWGSDLALGVLLAVVSWRAGSFRVGFKKVGRRRYAGRPRTAEPGATTTVPRDDGPPRRESRSPEPPTVPLRRARLRLH